MTPRSLNENGTFTRTISTTTADFAQQTKLEVWLRDSSPGGRGEAFKSKTSTSGVPQPGVSITKRLSCRDDDLDPTNECWSGHGNGKPPPCENESCGFIAIAVSGFYEDFDCTVSMSWEDPYDGWGRLSFRATYSGQDGADTNWYAPSGGGAVVTCRGTGPFGQVATASQPW